MIKNISGKLLSHGPSVAVSMLGIVSKLLIFGKSKKLRDDKSREFFPQKLCPTFFVSFSVHHFAKTLLYSDRTIPSLSKKDNEHNLDAWLWLTCLLRMRRATRCPLEFLKFCLRVIAIHPSFISSYNFGHKVRICMKTILQFRSN